MPLCWAARSSTTTTPSTPLPALWWTDSTKSNDVTETLDDQGLEINGDVTIYTNYKSDEEKNPTAADLVNTKGVEAQYIDNDNDGTVDVVVKIAKAFGKVSVYSEAGDGRLTITNLSNVDAEGKLDSTTAWPPARPPMMCTTSPTWTWRRTTMSTSTR